jgi:hypothetical protein
MIRHGDTGARNKLHHADLTERVIGAALEVHRVGLILNFYVPSMVRSGIVRKVL